MNYPYSPAAAEGFSQATCSAGAPSARSSSANTDEAPYDLASAIECCRPSPSGLIFEPSMGFPGADELTSYLAAFPARRIPRQLEAKTSRMISGRKCGESWQRQLPGTYLPRTLHGPLSKQPRTTSVTWVTKPDALPFPRQTWVVTTSDNAIGYVHTPTRKANYAASSMQKWPSCVAFVRAFGAPSPEVHEWLMDWPTGWSALKPLETARWRSWLQQHGVS